MWYWSHYLLWVVCKYTTALIRVILLVIQNAHVKSVFWIDAKHGDLPVNTQALYSEGHDWKHKKNSLVIRGCQLLSVHIWMSSWFWVSPNVVICRLWPLQQHTSGIHIGFSHWMLIFVGTTLELKHHSICCFFCIHFRVYSSFAHCSCIFMYSLIIVSHSKKPLSMINI